MRPEVTSFRTCQRCHGPVMPLNSFGVLAETSVLRSRWSGVRIPPGAPLVFWGFRHRRPPRRDDVMTASEARQVLKSRYAGACERGYAPSDAWWGIRGDQGCSARAQDRERGTQRQGARESAFPSNRKGRVAHARRGCRARAEALHGVGRHLTVINDDRSRKPSPRRRDALISPPRLYRCISLVYRSRSPPAVTRRPP